MRTRLPRAAITDTATIVCAYVAFLALLAGLGWAGLPFGMAVIPMGEDHNWVDMLHQPDAAATARAFWLLDGRNPLSPWWYIATKPAYLGFPNGPFLVRLAINPLLAIAAYAAVRTADAAANRSVALICGLAVAIWIAAPTFSQIHWNFLGALACALGSVALFGSWLRTERRSAVYYGLSLCLWLIAISTYAFEVGAILAIALLSLAAQLPERRSWIAGAWASFCEVVPFALILIIFMLIWTTSQTAQVHDAVRPQPALLLHNLPRSIVQGLWPTYYWRLLHQAFDALGAWLPLICATTGFVIALIIRMTVLIATPSLAYAAWPLALGWCLLTPALLVESTSSIWTSGSRSGFLTQACQPLIWLGTGWFISVLMPRLRAAFAGFGGIIAAVVIALSLGQNTSAVTLSVNDIALRDGLAQILANHPSDSPLHVVVLADRELPFADLYSQRMASVWFGDGRLTLRVISRDENLLRPENDPLWGDIILDNQQARNAVLGGGDVPYDSVIFAKYDLHGLTVLDRLTQGDATGYPIEWRRSQP